MYMSSACKAPGFASNQCTGGSEMPDKEVAEARSEPGYQPLRYPHVIALRTFCYVFIALTTVCSVQAIARAADAQVEAASNTPRIKLIRHKTWIDVDINGKLFTTYHFADDFVLPAVRPFFYPVLAADGTEMTIDHAQHPPLHAYQRSIWVGARDVNGADHWTFKARPVPRQRHIKFNYVNKDGFQEQLIWEDAHREPMLNEIRTVRFIAYRDGARQINFRLSFTPINKDVTFFNRGDHGFLSVRPNPQIAGNPIFTADNGASECDHHTAWCDESGQINGKTYGIAIFDTPGNPRHPPLWHAGKDQRLATDIFLQHPGSSKNDPNRAASDFTIKLGQTIAFQYRMLFHAGDADSGKVKERYADFVADGIGKQLSKPLRRNSHAPKDASRAHDSTIR